MWFDTAGGVCDVWIINFRLIHAERGVERQNLFSVAFLCLFVQLHLDYERFFATCMSSGVTRHTRAVKREARIERFTWNRISTGFEVLDIFFLQFSFSPLLVDSSIRSVNFNTLHFFFLLCRWKIRNFFFFTPRQLVERVKFQTLMVLKPTTARSLQRRNVCFLSFFDRIRSNRTTEKKIYKPSVVMSQYSRSTGPTAFAMSSMYPCGDSHEILLLCSPKEFHPCSEVKILWWMRKKKKPQELDEFLRAIDSIAAVILIFCFQQANVWSGSTVEERVRDGMSTIRLFVCIFRWNLKAICTSTNNKSY